MRARSDAGYILILSPGFRAQWQAVDNVRTRSIPGVSHAVISGEVWAVIMLPPWRRTAERGSFPRLVRARHDRGLPFQPACLRAGVRTSSSAPGRPKAVQDELHPADIAVARLLIAGAGDDPALPDEQEQVVVVQIPTDRS